MFELPIEYQKNISHLIEYGITTKFMIGSRKFGWMSYSISDLNIDIDTRHCRYDNEHILEISSGSFLIIGCANYQVLPNKSFLNINNSSLLWNGKKADYILADILHYFQMFSSSYSDYESPRVNVEMSYYGDLSELESLSTMLYMQEYS